MLPTTPSPKNCDEGKLLPSSSPSAWINDAPGSENSTPASPALKRPWTGVRVSLDSFWSRIVEIAALSQIIGVIIALAVLIYSVVPGDKVSFYQYRQDQAERRMNEASALASAAEARAHEAEQRGAVARARELAALRDADEAAQRLAKATEHEQAADSLRSQAELRTSQALASAKLNELNAREIEKRARNAAAALLQTSAALRFATSERDAAATQSRQIKGAYTRFVALDVFQLSERACAGDDLYQPVPSVELIKAGERLSDCMLDVIKWKADGQGNATVFYRDGLLLRGRGASASAVGAPLALVRSALASLNALSAEDRLELERAIVFIREIARSEAGKAASFVSLGDVLERAGETLSLTSAN